MKMTDLIKTIDKFDDGLIIFIEDSQDYTSDIIITNGENNEGLKKEDNGKVFSYLIEVSIAKDFINEWNETIPHSTNNDDELVRKLYEYAINDA